MKLWFFIVLFALSSWFSLPGTVQAGTLSELSAAVQSHYTAGDISDVDVKVTLDDLLSKAQTAADADAEAAYRNSIIDVVNAFTGAGINAAAATHLKTLAQP